MKSSHPTSTLWRYFAGLAEYVFQAKLGVADPPLVDYVSCLLTQFVRSDAMHKVRNPTGQPLTQVTEMLVEANARIGMARRDVHRHIRSRLRFEYDPPIPVLVVADGTWVVFHDSEINQVTRLPLGSTPLAVLLRDEIRLRGSVTVTEVARATGTLRITVIDSDATDQGSITLVFSDRPLALRQWLIRDPQGQETSIALSEIRYNMILKPELFVFFEPLDKEYQ